MAGSFFDADFDETKSSKQPFMRPAAPAGIKTAPVGRPASSAAPETPVKMAPQSFMPSEELAPAPAPPPRLPPELPPAPMADDVKLEAPPQADFLARLAAGLRPQPRIESPAQLGPLDTPPSGPPMPVREFQPLPMPPGAGVRQPPQQPGGLLSRFNSSKRRKTNRGVRMADTY